MDEKKDAPSLGGNEEQGKVINESNGNITESPKKGKKASRYRTFHIVQYERNPRTGEDLHFGEEQITSALNTYKCIHRWSYICHAEDTYTEAEIKNKEAIYEAKREKAKAEIENPDCPYNTVEEYLENFEEVFPVTEKVGDPKPPHWHVVISVSTGLTVKQVAKWFGVLSQYVEIPSGRGAFLDCVEYLTHEKVKEKHRYSDSDVHSNFDFRLELTIRNKSIEKYGREIGREQYYRDAVMHEGLTPEDVDKKDPLQFTNDYKELHKIRKEYLSHLPVPKKRTNFYICGNGGIGKGTVSELLARLLFPEQKNIDEIAYKIGGDNAGFDNYNAQSVIIWDDCRSYDLIKKGGNGNRGDVFNLFDPHPKDYKVSIKYGTIKLVNSVNIVNSPEHYYNFLAGLVGEYRDRNGTLRKAEDDDKLQSMRRFPFIISLRADDFDILVSTDYLKVTNGSIEKYIRFNIRGNFGLLAKCAEEDESIDELTLAENALFPLLKLYEMTQSPNVKIDASVFDEYKISLVNIVSGEVSEIKNVCDFFKREKTDFKEKFNNEEFGKQNHIPNDVFFIEREKEDNNKSVTDHNKYYILSDGRVLEADQYSTIKIGKYYLLRDITEFSDRITARKIEPYSLCEAVQQPEQLTFSPEDLPESPWGHENKPHDEELPF